MATLTYELRAVETAHDRLGLTYAEIASALTANESTLHRWRNGEREPTPVYLRRLDSLAEFMAELERMVKDPAHARWWLDRPVPLLDNRTPRDLLLEGRIEKLTGLLYNVNSGNAL